LAGQFGWEGWEKLKPLAALVPVVASQALLTFLSTYLLSYLPSNMPRPGYPPIERKYRAYFMSHTHKVYKAAWTAAGSPPCDKRCTTPWMVWGAEHSIPLNIPTLEKWIAENEKPAAPRLIVAEMAAAPAFYLNPFDDDALWEAVQQQRTKEVSPPWVC